jgi:hypothetical protein
VPDQPDQRRAAQIEAVIGQLDYCGLNPGAGAEYVAARLVDAVLANTGTCGQACDPLILGFGHANCALPAGHGGLWHEDEHGMKWTPRNAAGRDGQDEAWFTTADVAAARQRLADNRYGGDHDVHQLDPEDITEIIQIVLTATRQRAIAQERARVWRQAVQALRDDERYGTWWYATHSVESHLGPPVAARLHAADYLEAVGPGTVAAAFEAHADEALAIAEQALAAQAEVVHRCPPDTTGIMPCCGKPIMEAPKTDRITTEVERVTCSTRPDPEPAQTVPDGGDGAGVGERNDEGGTRGSGQTGTEP